MLKDVVTHHYRNRVNKAMDALQSFLKLPKPREGWIRTVRSALGMTGVQLSHNLNVSRSRVARVEQDELRGAVTLKTMQDMAEAMDCTFVYAIVPKGKVEDVIWQRALAKARQQVAEVGTHMALEGQTLAIDQTRFEEERVAKNMMARMPRDFWSDD